MLQIQGLVKQKQLSLDRLKRLDPVARASSELLYECEGYVCNAWASSLHRLRARLCVCGHHHGASH